MSILPNDNISSQAFEKKREKHKCYKIFFKTYKPQPSIKTAIVVLSILGIIFIVIGSILVVHGIEIKEFKEEFDPCNRDCDRNKNSPNSCENEYNVIINLTKKMKKPVFLYYQAHAFYQNHRKYSKSISYKQLKGEKITKAEAEAQCDMAYKGKDINRSRNLDPDYSSTPVAYPCGITAKSFLDIKINKNIESNGNEYIIDDDEISWAFDRNERFKSNADENYWTNVEDEHFIVWMKLGVSSNFKKLWGKIDNDLEKGKYTFKVRLDNACPKGSDVFDNFKLVLSTANSIGGDNSSLGIAYITVGSLTIISAIFFAVRGLLFKKSDDFHTNY